MSSDTYSIDIDESLRLVNIKAMGELDSEVAFKMAYEAGRAAGDHGFNRLLFDLRDTTINVSLSANYNFAAHPEDTEMRRNYKRAVVHSGDISTIKFFETVSDNHGYIVKVFSDINDALSWLTGD